VQPAFSFDEVHVVSDLHLGGADGFQIFAQAKELAGLVDFLRKKPKEQRIALVINGDFIDFLAEAPAKPFDPHGATAKLDRIASDGSFALVWKALTRFARTPERALLINIGNHDLELALPWVREHLVGIITGNDDAARGRVRVSYDGAGFALRVGPARVLCVHGNEVDAWNYGDHETIRRIGRDLNARRDVEPWIPNAGTQLVINVMNEVKLKYPFVDLLKPEKAAVVPILLTLEPALVSRVPDLFPAGARRSWDRVRKGIGFLGEDEALCDTDGGRPARSRCEARKASSEAARALLDITEERFRAGADALALSASGGGSEFLSGWRSAWKLVTGDRVEALREALEALKEDDTFKLQAHDETFDALDRSVGPEVDVLIAGHTHLERAIARRNGTGYYYNSGTWARLIELDAEVLDDPVAFAGVYDVLSRKHVQELDALPELVQKRASFVSVWRDGNLARSELRRFRAGAGPRPFDTVPGSDFATRGSGS